MLDAEDILANIHEYVYVSDTKYNDPKQREVLFNSMSNYLNDKFKTEVKIELKSGEIPQTHMYNIIEIEIYGEKVSLSYFTVNIDRYITQFNRMKQIDKIL